jgi:putative ABC transport system permease protein
LAIEYPFSDQDQSVMGLFAWRNLLTRPLRTTLALVGLSIPILGVLGLFSVSNGLRNLVGETLGGIEGLIVLSDNAPSPVFSNVPPDLANELRKMPKVRAVAPEVWGIAPSIEGRGMITDTISNLFKGKQAAKNRRQTSIFDQSVIAGQEIAGHQNLHSAVFPRALRDHGEGRYLQLGDVGQPNIVISRKTAAEYPDEKGNPKKVGDTLRIIDKPFKIVGIYETGSMLLDVVILMDIETARGVLHKPPGSVSCIYVEGEKPEGNDDLAAAIEKAHPGFDARSMNEAQENFSSLMGQVDTFLLMTVSLALIVGIVGIINTMLMSTTERFAEFGVLRTNGWSRGNILALVTMESAYLGLLSGLAGCAMAGIGMMIANPFIGGGIHLGMTPSLMGIGIALSVVMGMIGGLYPAWQAARLVPMEAIRLGSH